VSINHIPTFTGLSEIVVNDTNLRLQRSEGRCKFEYFQAPFGTELNKSSGFNESTNIGRIVFPAVCLFTTLFSVSNRSQLQCVAAFATSYPEIWGHDPNKDRTKAMGKIPCLIPCKHDHSDLAACYQHCAGAIDQDPYFRLVRDNCHRMKNPSPKPALVRCHIRIFNLEVLNCL
jgi:hypothetical protein